MPNVPENLQYERVFKFFVYYYLFFARLCSMWGILVPQPGIKPVPRTVEEQSLNHWTASEVQKELF